MCVGLVTQCWRQPASQGRMQIILAFHLKTLSSWVCILTEEITELPAGRFGFPRAYLVFKALSAGLKLNNGIKRLNQLGGISCCLQMKSLFFFFCSRTSAPMERA